MKDHTHELKDAFWDRLEDVTTGMLGTPSAPARPMAHIVRDEDEGVFWFVTDAGTDIAQAAAAGTPGTYLVASQSENLFANIAGHLTIVHDAKVLEDIWSPIIGAWFEDGREDPDVRLIKFTPSEAEIWLTNGNAKFLYEIAKANLTDTQPDAGQHGKVTF